MLNVVLNSRRKLDMKIRQIILPLLSLAGLAALPLLAKAQSLANSGDSSSTAALPASTAHPQPDLTYVRPTQKTRLHNYFFDTFGPYPIVGAAFAAGI